MNKYGKFAVLIVIVVATLVWLAASSMKGSQTYYKTLPEMAQMTTKDLQKKFRVGGDVQPGSIVRKSDVVEFTLVQDKLQLKVAYQGEDPLPDTFRDGAQALADGSLGPDGVFHAKKIQAKCASKYAPKPGQAPAGLKPVRANI